MTRNSEELATLLRIAAELGLRAMTPPAGPHPHEDESPDAWTWERDWTDEDDVPVNVDGVIEEGSEHADED